MYTRLTPRGRSVGTFGAKALLVIAVITGITCVARSFRSALSSPERASGYYTAPPATQVPSPVVVVRKPTVPQAIMQVDNVAKPVPRPPIRQPRMNLPAGRITFVPLLKNSTASSPQWEESSFSPAIPPSLARSDDSDRRRYEDHYARQDTYRPPPPRITYKRVYAGTSYAGRSSSLRRQDIASRDGERQSHR